MKKIQLTKGAVEILLHNSESMTDYLLGLYKAVIDHEWDQIKQFNGHPIVSKETATEILNLAHTKYEAGTVNLMWLNKGFSSSGENLKLFQVQIPTNLYTLNPPPIPDPNKEIEEFFNETEHDAQEQVKENL